MKKHHESRHSANEEPLLKESIFRIGKVISVEGRKITVSVDKSKNSSHLFYKGEVLKNISVGGYVKILKGFSTIIAKVDGEFVQEDKIEKNRVYKSNKDKIYRVLNVSLLGFFDGRKFRRGVKELPLIDNECFLLEREEFFQVHNFVSDDDESLTIGSLAMEGGQEISFGINRLFASHIGIFGNTGSGKSYTLAKLYHELFRKFKKNKNFIKRAKFLLIDFNGEYVSKDSIVEAEYKNTFNLSTRSKGDKLPVLSDYLNEAPFWTILLEATDKTQQPFLARAVKNKKITKAIENNATFKNLIISILENIFRQNTKTLDKNIIINLLKALKLCLGPKAPGLSDVSDDYLEHLHWHTKGASYIYVTPSIETYANNAEFLKTVVLDKFEKVELKVEEVSLLEKIRLKIVVQYYDEITRGYSNVEHLAPLIGRLDQRITELNKIIEVQDEIKEVKNFTIISLRDVNLHMKKVIPMLVCNQTYGEKKSNNDDQTYLNIIIDEAHNILSEESQGKANIGKILDWRPLRK